MKVTDLTREQLTILKGNYIDEQNQAKGIGTSWGELADADNIVSDEEIFSVYENYEFFEDDF